ncbi:hypothetical protein [Mesorhizobium sp.]|uniref:hypothetical protein n=1 Tax=Mesorhizobium sp. TaxID=1871066 RepID=UPI000FE8E511|nr:hypothetical protein [Mesorhizobium sp.]RWP35037.1 MAG: hypothetical protein EOR04_31565 [Mesorhizobium sp.]RWP60711.1 MAG: hypothetical protein EOR08_20175 [Mesorhizobium sp.]
MTDPRVQALCDELGIKIVDRHRYPEPGEARAVETLARIIRRHGEGHLRLVLSTLAETDNNKGQLDEVLFWAASDMVRACPEILERRAGDWLTMWDVCPLGELQFIAQDLRGVVPLIFAFCRYAIRAGGQGIWPASIQPDLFDDRRRNSA